MITDSQANRDTPQGLETDSHSALAAPYRHKGYKKVLHALREALDQDNAVLLKGVEGTGKSTLVQELISEYKHRAIPIVSLNEPLEKAAQLYAQIADSLAVPKEKKALISALRNTREAGQFCLVVVDQGAVNSSPEVTQALQQLCKTSETTAGAIKLIVVSKDYLVIHAEGTPQADFHDWIHKEIKLNPLQTDDIEGFIYYLCALKNLQPTPYEIGTDFVMIEQTEGRIGRLKALLLPLIHKDVITRNDIASPEHSGVSMPSFGKQRTGVIALGLVLLLAVGVGIQQFFFATKPVPPAVVETTAPLTPPPVFAEPTSNTSEAPAVTPPSIVTPEPEILAAEEETLGVLPLLNPEDSAAQALEDLPSAVDLPAAGTTELPNTELPNIATVDAPAETTPKQTREDDIKRIVALPEAEFQKTIRSQLDLIEKELAAAIAENKRLQTALVESATEKVESAIQDIPASDQLAVAALEGTATTPQLEQTLVNSTPAQQITPTAQQRITEQTKPVEVATSYTNNQAQDFIPTTAPTVATTDIATTNTVPTDSVSGDAPATASTDPEFNTAIDQAIAAINAWQQAWQKRDHAAYVARYKANFNGAFTSHQRWLKKRYDALNRPEWIKLKREELFNIYELKDQIKIDFWLNYEASSGYKDRTLKRLTLIQEDNQWLISKEQNIKVEHPY